MANRALWVTVLLLSVGLIITNLNLHRLNGVVKEMVKFDGVHAQVHVELKEQKHIHNQIHEELNRFNRLHSGVHRRQYGD